MRIFIDINHPSHVHFFKEFILRGKELGHEFLITARDKDCILRLCRAYDIPFISKGTGATSLIGKAINMVRELIFIYRKVRVFKPSLYVSFASPYAAITGFLLKKPVITFDDTEPDPLLHNLFPRFSTFILTPACYEKDFGSKHIRFRGYKESTYLRTYPVPTNIRRDLGVKDEFPLVMMRFVKQNATHARGQKGISPENRLHLVKTFSTMAHVLISTESTLPEPLRSYQIDPPPEKMHDLIASCSLLIGESTTMAAEAALLNVPSICIENKGRGYIKELQEKYKIIKWFTESQQKEALSYAEQWFQQLSKQSTPEVRQQILARTTDITEMLLWLIRYFPSSLDVLKDDPEKIKEF